MSGRFLIGCLLVAALFGCRPPEKAVAARSPDARASLAIPSDGYFKANIASALGMFSRDVLVSGGEIRCVQWSKEHCVPFNGLLTGEGKASGILQSGDMVEVQLLAQRND